MHKDEVVNFLIALTSLVIMYSSPQVNAFYLHSVQHHLAYKRRILPPTFLRSHTLLFGFNFNSRHWNSNRLLSCIAPVAHGGDLDVADTVKNEKMVKFRGGSTPRIAIIGGGICGVTSAKAIWSRMKTIAPDQKIEITVFEADPESCKKYAGGDDNGLFQQPKWKAATARNANSLVPGAAHGIMSQRKTLLDIIRDTAKEQYLNVRDGDAGSRDFSEVPPYFGFSLSKCLGWSASWEERRSFMNFFFHFVKVSLLTGEKEAKKRGKVMVQLAKANRFALTKELETMQEQIKDPAHKIGSNFGIQQGFISVHRTKQEAQQTLEEVCKFGEEAEILTKSQALELEPKITNLPFQDAHFVHRKNDMSGSCIDFVRSTIESIKNNGIQYRVDSPVHSIRKNKDGSFQLNTDNGGSENFDFVIVAAGIFTPMFAMKIGASSSCPVYPLRGYSLTVATRPSISGQLRGNYLQKAMSFDHIYCTSVANNMVRLAGFGEIIGFPKASKDSAPSPGPRVLEKYANYIFGKDAACEIVKTSIPCFRPLSPDDVPLVGSVKGIPGLFLHTGHGTLGWTLSLATAHCLAQDVCDKIIGTEGRDVYILPDGSSIEKECLSPNRFALSPEVSKPN